MHSLVLIGLFVGWGLILAFGFICVARDLQLRIERPLPLPDDDTEETEQDAAALAGQCRFL